MLNKTAAFKGVNLGGWLVIEKWMTPELFYGTDAVDEWTLSQTKNAKNKIEEHRKTFITHEDFQWLAKHNFKYLRIPIGYWIFGGQDPYYGGIKYLDFAFEQASQTDMKVIVDLHGLPGSQNGHDHSGRAGNANWHKEESNIIQSLDLVKKIVMRYKSHPAYRGIEVINEPDSNIPHKILSDYYRSAYRVVRETVDNDSMIIISDAWRPNDWSKEFNNSHKNIYLDIHLYQVFSEADKTLDLSGHLRKTSKEWKKLIRRNQRHVPVIIGEWSADLYLHPKDIKNIGAQQAFRRYAAEQLKTYNYASGQFYWSYKHNNPDRFQTWNLRKMIENGTIVA